MRYHRAHRRHYRAVNCASVQLPSSAFTFLSLSLFLFHRAFLFDSVRRYGVAERTVSRACSSAEMRTTPRDIFPFVGMGEEGVFPRGYPAKSPPPGRRSFATGRKRVRKTLDSDL